jgi:anti-sigma-K factor RskA
MTEDFNLEALRYLLDELNAQARADFESRLDGDPAAREALKNCSAAIAHFAADTAPAEALQPAAQRTALAHILSTVADEPRIQLRQRSAWKRFAWPLAASVLLVLNLVQYFRPVSNDAFPSNSARRLASDNSAAPRDNSSHSPGKKILAQSPVAAKREPHGLQAANPPGASVRDELRRLEKLRTEYATLKRARETLNSEYNGVIQQLAEHALVNKGVGRLAAMELVDAGAYARGERKGLVDIARGLLTEPGIVTMEPVIPPDTPQTIAPTSPSLTTGPMTSAPDSLANTNTDLSNATTTPPTTTLAETPQTSNPTGKSEAYAWSVFDESSSRGYLNLYNLPATPADQSLQLWVQIANSDAYLRVGEIPAQFYGGSGSLHYNLPGATQPPSDILVTQEPRNALPAQPTGPTVLHGP